MRISDWSSDVCSSDLRLLELAGGNDGIELPSAEEHRLSRDREGRHGTVVDRETAGDHDKPGIGARAVEQERRGHCSAVAEPAEPGKAAARIGCDPVDRKSTRLNSSH